MKGNSPSKTVLIWFSACFSLHCVHVNGCILSCNGSALYSLCEECQLPDHRSYWRVRPVIKETSCGPLDYIFLQLGEDFLSSFSLLAKCVLVAYLISEANVQLPVAVRLRTSAIAYNEGITVAAKWLPPVRLLVKHAQKTAIHTIRKEHSDTHILPPDARRQRI